MAELCLFFGGELFPFWAGEFYKVCESTVANSTETGHRAEDLATIVPLALFFFMMCSSGDRGKGLQFTHTWIHQTPLLIDRVLSGPEMDALHNGHHA